MSAWFWSPTVGAVLLPEFNWQVNRGYFLHLIGPAHLPIVLHGSVHHQKCPMAERNPNLLHISEVAILFLRVTKKENTYWLFYITSDDTT